MLRYRKGEYDPEVLIQRIPDENVQQLVRDMTQKDPTKRSEAKKYLSQWTGTLFPEYFTNLHGYISQLMALEPEEKINTIMRDFDDLLARFTGTPQAPAPKSPQRSPSPPLSPKGNNSTTLTSDRAKEMDKIWNNEEIAKEKAAEERAFRSLMDTEEALQRLESGEPLTLPPDDLPATPSPPSMSQSKPIINADTCALSADFDAPKAPTTLPPPGSEGAVMLLAMVTAFLHSCRSPSAKLTALDFFDRCATVVDSEARLQRIVPYVLSLINDESALVRADAIRVLTHAVISF